MYGEYDEGAVRFNRKGQVTHVCCRANASRVDMKPVSGPLSVFSIYVEETVHVYYHTCPSSSFSPRTQVTLCVSLSHLRRPLERRQTGSPDYSVYSNSTLHSSLFSGVTPFDIYITPTHTPLTVYPIYAPSFAAS